MGQLVDLKKINSHSLIKKWPLSGLKNYAQPWLFTKFVITGISMYSPR